MDPITAVGLVASIAQIIDATTKTIKYLNDVKSAPKERSRLALEATRLLVLLTDLRYEVDEVRATDPLLTAVGTLGEPLEQFKDAIETLKRKLKPRSGVRKLGTALLWSLNKKEIDDILSQIERLKSLIGLALQRDQLALSLAMKDDIAKMSKNLLGISDGVAAMKEKQIDYELQDIVKWLSPINFSAKQNDIFSRWHEGTGQWLVEHNVFKAWENGTQKVLWCPGIPGSGKTVLASVVVDYLKRKFQRDNVGIACIYCSYEEQHEQTTTDFIAALLQQIIQRLAIVPDDVRNLYKTHTSTWTRPSVREFSNLLQSNLHKLSKTFVILDGLDECLENNRESLIAEIQKLPPSVHLLVTSRQIADIERLFENAARLEILARDEDVRRYLEGRIAGERRLNRLITSDPTLRDPVINTIVEKAEGMFLLARLHMDSLTKEPSSRKVRSALGKLPKGLDDTYHEILRRIWSQGEADADLAKQVLSWIVFAVRPLTIKEIQHALAVEPEDTDIEETALPDEDILVSICAGIVSIDRESGVVRLVHYTTQEYFERFRMDQFPDAQKRITATCLIYLSFDIFARGYCLSDEDMNLRLHNYPLLRYAAQHWGDHARGPPELLLREKILGFLQQESKVLSSMQAFCIPEYKHNAFSQHFPKDVPALHVASLFGLTKIAEALLEAGANINAIGGDGLTALHRAAVNGYEAAVELLVKRGANVNAQSDNGPSALHRAAVRGYEGVVHLLLDHGADINTRDGHGRTALHGAAANGRIVVTQLLLDWGIDVNTKDQYGWAALHGAAAKGHQAIVLILLRKGANINAKDQHGRTALHRAAVYGREAAVRLLLEEGADIDVRDDLDRTALLAAAAKDHELVKRLLIQHGAHVGALDDCGRATLHRVAAGGTIAGLEYLLEEGAVVDAKDDYGCTALHMAAAKGNEAAARLLLKYGADVDITDNDGGSALHWAATYGHGAMERLLLKGGANVNAMKDWGDLLRPRGVMIGGVPSPKETKRWLPTTMANIDAEDNLNRMLHYGWYGHKRSVQQMLEEGTDINAKYERGWTVLHQAASGGNWADVQLFLEKNADINVRDDLGWTALHRAAWNRHMMVVQLLVEKGADASLRDTNGWTALHRAAKSGDRAIVLLLLRRIEDIDAQDQYGRTVLHLTAMYGCKEMAVVLIEKQANINAKDKLGQTAVHWAARGGHNAVLHLVVENGADIDAKDYHGRTALHWAAAYGREATVVQLLEDGAGVNVKAKLEWTALHQAAAKGNRTIAKLLLEKGADIDAKDDRGCTALNWAAQYSQMEIAQLLIATVANDCVTNNQRNMWLTESSFARPMGHSTGKLRPSPVDVENESRWTPLDQASWNGHEAVEQLLLGEQSDINAKDNRGWTALHQVAHNGHTTAVQLLLEMGADIDATDQWGKTALYWAAEKHQEAVVLLLLDNASINEKSQPRGTTLESIDRLAFRLQNQGKYNVAEALSRRTLEYSEKTLGPDHPDTVTRTNYLVVMLWSLGRYREAEAIGRRTLERQEVLGVDPSIMLLGNLGAVLRDQGSYEAAEVMTRRALEADRTTLGLDHPSTLASLSNLALTLKGQGKYKEAEALSRQAVEGREKVLGTEHPKTLISVSNLAEILNAQGKYEAAEAMNQRALEGRTKVLGPDHPETLMSVNNLAEVLKNQGRYEDAEATSRQALHGLEKVLRLEHPMTLVSVSNLAEVLSAQGKHTTAEALSRQALEGRMKVLGPEHPDTVRSANHLADVVKKH